jgi:hypothetical protein
MMKWDFDACVFPTGPVPDRSTCFDATHSSWCAARGDPPCIHQPTPPKHPISWGPLAERVGFEPAPHAASRSGISTLASSRQAQCQIGAHASMPPIYPGARRAVTRRVFISPLRQRIPVGFSGGESGIRTHETLLGPTRSPGVRLKPDSAISPRLSLAGVVLGCHIWSRIIHVELEGLSP